MPETWATRTPQAAEQSRTAAAEVRHVLTDPRLASLGDVMALQRTVGNRAVAQLIQAKLKVGAANDVYEQEADRVADQVVRTPVPTAAPVHGSGKGDQLHATATGAAKRVDTGADLERRPSAARNGGEPLPDQTRAFMEPRFAADFSGVRLHRGRTAARLNRAIGARAFTLGRDIFIAEGHENVDSTAGHRLLAHELTHVVQQTGDDLQRAYLSSGRQAEGHVTDVLLHTRAPGLIQRDPLVYDEKGEYVDATSWDEQRITEWIIWYKQSQADETEFLTSNKAEFDKSYADLVKLAGDVDWQEALKEPLVGRVGREEKMRAAEKEIRRLRDADPALLAIQVDTSKVAEELKEAVSDPAKMDQKGYPLCGVDTYLRMYAVHHPDEYARFVVDLLTTGQGSLGKQAVKVPSSVKAVAEKTAAGVQQTTAEEQAKWAESMNVGEWVAEASIRGQFNSVLPLFVKDPSNEGALATLAEQASQCTTVAELRDWFIAAGVDAQHISWDRDVSVIRKSSLKTMIDKMNAAYRADNSVALAINQNIVNNPYDQPVALAPLSGHLVYLASEIRLTSDKKNYVAAVMTWGAKRPIRFPVSETEGSWLSPLTDVIRGYVAVDLAKFKPGSTRATKT